MACVVFFTGSGGLGLPKDSTDGKSGGETNPGASAGISDGRDGIARREGSSRASSAQAPEQKPKAKNAIPKIQTLKQAAISNPPSAAPKHGKGETYKRMILFGIVTSR
jgi:hypothetical protein